MKLTPELDCFLFVFTGMMIKMGVTFEQFCKTVDERQDISDEIKKESKKFYLRVYNTLAQNEEISL